MRDPVLDAAPGEARGDVMSILIKGMEMPKSCYSCNFCQYYAEPNQGCYCLALFVDLHRTNFVKERLTNCPLIEVPKHGNLIDRDALMKKLNNCMFPSDMVTTRAISMAMNWLKEYPTIIESE